MFATRPPDLIEVRQPDRGLAEADGLVGQDDDGDLEPLGDVEGPQGLVEAVLDRRRRQDDPGGIAGQPVDGELQVGLLRLGRQAGRRAAALDIDDDDGQLGHGRQVELFAHELEAGTARSP